MARLVSEPSLVLIAAAVGALLGPIAAAASTRIADSIGGCVPSPRSRVSIAIYSSIGMTICGAYLAAHYRPIDASARVLFLAVLLGVALIDVRARIIPNFLTIPGIVLGAFAGAMVVADVGYRSAMLGIAGALLVMLSGELYRLVRGREGIGMGDIKLMLMIGGFAGWSGLIFAVGAGAVSALFTTFTRSAVRTDNSGSLMLNTFAFGPYLCAAAAVYLLFQSRIAGS